MAPDIDSATQLLKDGKIWTAVKGSSLIFYIIQFYTLQSYFPILFNFIHINFLLKATSRQLKTTWT